MVSCQLTILPGADQLTVPMQSNLLDVFREYHVSLESACGGRGTCGKCKIQIISGEVSSPTGEELSFLSPQELQSGFRLACFVRIQGNLIVKLVENPKKTRIVTSGYLPDFRVKPVIRKQAFLLSKPTLEKNLSYLDVLSAALNLNLSIVNPTVLQELAKLLPTKEVLTAVMANDELMGLERGDTVSECFGVAIDIGTTTVVASLVNLNTGQEIGSTSALNPQTEYGLDVLSRITFTRQHDNGLILLHEGIISCLNNLIKRLCELYGVAKERIYELAVAANSTMMHLLFNVHPASLGHAPYTPIFSGAQECSALMLGFRVSPWARLYCLPGVSSYVGADIVAGTVVAGLDQTAQNILFIDIGTNGEMVLAKGGELSACSCAAGPALEGMNISCGMRAAEGAIEGVQIDGEGVHLHVISQTDSEQSEPCGLCGSGIIDAISEIVRIGLVESSGRLKTRAKLVDNAGKSHLTELLPEDEQKRRVVLARTKAHEDVFLTQSDIRQVQLAKGAILSGIYALAERLELDLQDLDEVIIAGGFGAHVKTASLIGLGLVPAELSHKVRYIGNSAKAGALMCLLSHEVRTRMERVAKQINYFELSADPDYERLFTKCLSFPKFI